MKVKITEYLQIDLETEKWVCRCCDAVLISAHENYKKGTLIHAHDPREIHRPLISEEDFRYTFAPDPELCVIYEFYCPSCGVLIETEYQVPGHMPVHDIELDIPALKAQWAEREETQRPYMGPDVEFMPNRDHPHHHHQ